jgi:ABC-type lipoprotein export system ATPase subunit
MVTHDHKMASYADRIEIIQDGIIVKDEILKKHHIQLMKNITKNI